MEILGGIPILHCRTINATLDFYQQLFQFVVVNKRESDDCMQWVHIMHGSTTLMLQSLEQSPSETENSRQSSISLYFFVNNIKDLHHFIKAKHNDVSEIKLTDYQMQEFSVLDPEGNTITLGQKC